LGETKNGMGTDLEWGRRRATRVEGAAAEAEGYRQFAARRKISSIVWWTGMESSLERGQGRVEQEGRREIGGGRRH
jgi:hypothetical protein